MDAVISNMNTRVLKEPLGFIRLLQFPMTILAFAATAGYSVKTIFSYQCPGVAQPSEHSVYWGYAFDLTSVSVPANFCDSASKESRVVSAYGAVSQSQFFVFTGVIAFIYILLALLVYLFAWSAYENDNRFALGDFVVTAVLALFWFISSCAWASGVSLVKGQTEISTIMTRIQQHDGAGVYPCNSSATPPPCTIAQPHWNYASLNVSLIAGFACFGLWAANLWFIFKETVWYKARATEATPQGTGPGAGLSAAGAGAPGGRGFTTGGTFH